MNEFVISPNPPATTGDLVRQSCRFRRPERSGAAETVLWWDGPATLAPLPEGDAEPHLIAGLFAAMAEGRDVRVEGAIGQRLLANLEEFMIAWCRWKPSCYRKVRIVPDQVRDDPPAAWSPTAVAAFSGGVDATYTVWRHHTRAAGPASRSIVACALVQGFDMPIGQDEKFAVSLDLARRTLDPLGIEVVALRTNLREAFPLDWHDLHGAALVAALQLLKSKAGAMLIGSSDPYDQLLLPYGSNPLTDPMLSTGSMEVVHDGCGLDRTGKIAAISGWADGCANLRVCWKGEQIGANCGRCEKCLRTRLNFLVNGLVPPESLAPPGSRPDFSALDSESESVLQEHVQILQAARDANLQDPWVHDLARRLAWLRARNAARDRVRAARRLVKRWVFR